MISFFFSSPSTLTTYTLPLSLTAIIVYYITSYITSSFSFIHSFIHTLFYSLLPCPFSLSFDSISIPFDKVQFLFLFFAICYSFFQCFDLSIIQPSFINNRPCIRTFLCHLPHSWPLPVHSLLSYCFLFFP